MWTWIDRLGVDDGSHRCMRQIKYLMQVDRPMEGSWVEWTMRYLDKMINWLCRSFVWSGNMLDRQIQNHCIHCTFRWNCMVCLWFSPSFLMRLNQLIFMLSPWFSRTYFSHGFLNFFPCFLQWYFLSFRTVCLFYAYRTSIFSCGFSTDPDGCCMRIPGDFSNCSLMSSPQTQYFPFLQIVYSFPAFPP